MKLTIDRTKWLRGQKEPTNGKRVDTTLWNKDVKCGCCLGLMALQVGYMEDELADITTPSKIRNKRVDNEYFERLYEEDIYGSSEFSFFNSSVGSSLMLTNDNCYMEDVEREKELTVLFEKISVDVEFIN